MRDRLLTEHFLQRFLQNDLLSPEADRHDALAMVCGGLLTLGLFLSILISLKFLFMPFPSPGRIALLALPDRLVFIAIATIVMALVAVLTWDALSLDARDTVIFGPLPLERGVIVRAKLRAVAILAAGFAMAISSLSSVFHPTLMVARLPVGLTAVVLIAVHLLVMLGAGIFGFCCVVVVRELCRAALGVRFARISAALQAVMIVALITTFLLLPAIMARAGFAESRAVRIIPPLWFLGLQEALAGEIVAGMPPGSLPDRVVPEEMRALSRYHEITARITPLAGRAVLGLTMSMALAVALYFWNSRELPLPLVGSRAARSRGPGLLARLAMATVARRPATQAGFFFTLHCMFRSGPHRVVMACCTALALALAMVFLAAGSRAAHPEGLPGSLASTQTLALAIMLAGFRHVSRLPADAAANRLFRLAWVTDGVRFVAGVRGGALVGIVLPVVLALLTPHVYILGPRLAAMHALTGMLLGAAIVSLMLSNTNRLPFVASYAPARDLNTVGPVILIGGMIGVSIVAAIERFALSGTRSAIVFWSILTLIALLQPLLARRNTQLDLPTAFDVPAAGTTRLDLG